MSRRPLHPEEIAERKAAFHEWASVVRDEVCLMPPNRQDRVHGLMKLAFNAGANFERRKNEPTQLGGVD